MARSSSSPTGLLQSLKRSAFLLVMTTIVGCGVPWQVVKQSGPPSALKGASAIAVSFDYTGMIVGGMGGDKPEAQWVAEKSAEDANYQQTWTDLKSKWELAVTEGLAASSGVPVTRGTGTPVGSEAADVTIQLNNLQVGKYIVVGAKASAVQVTHTWSRGGQVVDEITTKTSVTPSMTQPSIFQHVAVMGKTTGKLGGKFFVKAQK
jgi:hypothetical protein